MGDHLDQHDQRKSQFRKWLGEGKGGNMRDRKEREEAYLKLSSVFQEGESVKKGDRAV